MWSGVTDGGDQRLSLTVRAVGDVVEIGATGEIDALSAALLHREVTEAVRLHRPARLDLEMSGISFLDSAGIGCLLLCLSEADRLGCRLALTRPQAMSRRSLEVTGLTERLGVTP